MAVKTATAIVNLRMFDNGLSGMIFLFLVTRYVFRVFQNLLYLNPKIL